ncbi:MAG: cell division protein FtsA [Alphaproteobacteria bacterium]|nr:cell division protein FtsA [Alphaproteobacteria bacterium]
MGAFEARLGLRDRTGGHPPLAAVDIGSGKIACLIAAAPADGPSELAIDILGVGALALRHGGGCVTDPDTQVRMLRVACDQALRMAGDAMPAFATAYAGGDLVTTRATGVVRVKKGIITPKDVSAAIAAARVAADLEGRRLLHCQPIGYSIDDNEPIADPRGLDGQELAVEVCLVHAPAEAVAALEETIVRAGFSEPVFVVAGPFAAAHAVLSAEEREAGAVVIDFGEAQVGIAVFEDGELRHAETLSGAGARLTLDLAARLNTTFAVAERAKLAHGALSGDYDLGEALEVPTLGEDGRLEQGRALRGAFAEALLPRLEEIFERIGQRLSLAGYGAAPAGYGVALTGGVSLTPGIRQIAHRILKRPVRLAQPVNFAGFEHGAACATHALATGVLRCGFSRLAAAAPQPVRARMVAGPAVVREGAGVGGGAVVTQAVAWIKENF